MSPVEVGTRDTLVCLSGFEDEVCRAVCGGGEWWRRPERTDGGGFDHVADGKSLDCLVFRGTTRAVGASDGLDVTATGLVPAVGRSFLDHFGG